MATYTENGYTKLEAFRANGYVVLEPYAGEVDPQEWLGVEWVDWKSSGDTRFAPLASAYGDIECDGFWNHTPPKTDKDGVWIESQTALAPTLTARAQEPGANVGRCRIIELQPNQYGECLYNLHRDDNNRLNPEGTGWIVRGFFNLTDDKDSMMVLREVKDDAATETRIALPKGAQLIVDTQRLYHAVYHPGDEARYCLITSWESGPELDAYIEKHSGVSYVESYALSEEEIAAGEALAQSKRDARAAALAARGQDPRFGDGTLTVLEEQMGGGMEMEQLSEA